jgi:MFS family permease
MQPKSSRPLGVKAAHTVRLLSWFNFLSDFRLYAPVAVLYYAQISGSFAAGMSVFSATMLASVILELPTGVLSDWIGRRRTLIVGSALSALSIALYAAAPGIGILLVGAVLEGASRAFFSGNNNALLFDCLREEAKQDRFHDYLGRVGSYCQFALAVSAVLGSVLAQRSFRLVMAASVVPQVAGTVLCFFVHEPERTTRERGPGPLAIFGEALRRFFRNRRIVVVGGANMLSNAVGEACYQFSSAFVALLWPVWAIGISRSFSNLGAAVSFRIAGRLIDRFRELPLLIAARLYGRISTIVATVFPSVASPVIISSSSLFFGVSVVSAENILQSEFSDGERATMGSIGSMGESVLAALFAPLLGLVADAAGPAIALLSAQLIMLVPIAILTAELARHRKK